MTIAIPQKENGLRRSQTVAGLLEEAIDSGGYVAGDRLPSEFSLSTEYQVSRTIVREALKHLAGKGLVVTKNGSGSYVAAGDPAQIGQSLRRLAITADGATLYDILEIRVMLECGCAAKVARSQNMKEISKLAGPLTAMRNAVNEKLELCDVNAFINADIEFHRTIVNCGNNGIISAIQNAIEQSMEVYLKKIMTPVTLKTALAEHEAIAEAIWQSNAEKAEQLMAKHIYHSTELAQSDWLKG